MNLKLQLALMCLAVAGLGACATTPQQRYAGRIDAAQAAGRPLVVYGLSGDLTRKGCRLVRKDCGRLSFYSMRVGFINADPRPIEKLVFKVGLEKLSSNKPVLGPNGEPFHVRLTAKGPFVPGSSHVVAGEWNAANWPVAEKLLASGNSCVRVDGISVTYPDGTELAVPRQEAAAYLIPQARIPFRCAYFMWYRGLPSVSYSPIWTPPPNG